MLCQLLSCLKFYTTPIAYVKGFKVGYLFCPPVDASAVVSVSVVVSNKKTWGDTRWTPLAVIAGA